MSKNSKRIKDTAWASVFRFPFETVVHICIYIQYIHIYMVYVYVYVYVYVNVCVYVYVYQRWAFR
jgi:hypothetical protein